MSSLRILVIALIFAALQGCVAVPHTVPAEVLATTDIEIAPETLVSVGPRRLIEDLHKHILEQDETITIVDSLAFRDLAYPEGGWALSHLLDPEASADISQRADTRYVVLLGPAALSEASDEKGGYVPALVGAQSSKITTRLTAAIFDLTNANLVNYVRSEAEGSFAAVTWVVASAIKVPMTETSAFNGLGKAIVDQVGPGASLVILAADGCEEPFVLATTPDYFPSVLK